MALLFIIIITVLIILFCRSLFIPSESSEEYTASVFRYDSKKKQSGKVLCNIYLPRETGDTTEIDILYITPKGLIVVEDKNYSGYIFGDEDNRNWTETLYAGKGFWGQKTIEKHKFYNPVWQNRTHIKYLLRYLHSSIRTFSIITFSNKGNLKDVAVTADKTYVCYHSELNQILREIDGMYSNVLSDARIDEIYNLLLPLTNADAEKKAMHVENIHKRFNSTDICPVCGGKLVLRTAKKGSNAGNQFYGCSNYPKCKYTRNLK